MRRFWILLVGSVLIAGVEAQAPSRSTITIRFSTHQTCLVADADIPCGEVGEKLRAQQVPLNADIHIIGNLDAKASVVLPLLDSLNQSLERVGYQVKRAYITTPAT
jgi:hypothetical protein